MPGIKISDLVVAPVIAGDIVITQRGTSNYGGTIGNQISTIESLIEAFQSDTSTAALSIKVDQNNLYTNSTASLLFDNNNGTTVGRILWDETSSTFNLGYGANNHLTIKSSGNVGIGTTTPTAALQVVGNVHAGLSTTGTSCNFIGSGAGESNSGHNSSGFGYQSLRNNTGDHNTASGYYSLRGNTGNYNTASGNWSLYGNTGANNTASGYVSLLNNTGSGNTATGRQALQANTGDNNTASGYLALYLNIGSSNTASGYNSGRFQSGGTTSLTTASNSVFIGATTKGVQGAANQLVLGYAAESLGANTVVLGNDSIVTTALKGNVGIGTTAPGAELDVAGGIITTSGVATTGTRLRLTNPGGGSTGGSSTQVGAIKVTLPVSWTNTMLRMTIKVYDYATNESFTVVCGGYTYAPSTQWINHFAYIESAASKDTNFTVRFGHDGTKCCIYIGELNSVWSYPQVYVTEVEAGFSFYTVANWQDGWAVGFEASAFGVVTKTQTDTQINNWSRSGQDVHFSSGTGNVGIGTDAPVEKLDVVGNINVDTTGSYKKEGNTILDYDSTLLNTSVGNAALSNALLTGVKNTAMGYATLPSNTIGSGNNAIGYAALNQNTEGNYNSAMGTGALNQNTTGSHNLALGYQAGRYTTGNQNTATGAYSLYSNTIGGYNSAIGYAALFSNTTGSHNLAIGYQAGRYQADGATALSVADDSIFIGKNTKGVQSATNQIVIGDSAEGLGSNTTVLGSAVTTLTRLFGKLALGKDTATTPLHVYEDNTSGGSANGITIEQDGTGDSILQFLLTGAERWMMGVDNSDGDKFKIEDGTGLTSAAALTIDTASNVGIGTASPTVALDVSGSIAATGTIKATPTTVAALPAASTAGAGARTFVTDSNNSLSSHHGQTVTGGGANFTPVYSDGTNWRVG